MARRGRPPLTDDVLEERIAAYCARYGVSERNEAGFPAFPSGRRETRQHREWLVLYKAFQRLQARQGAVGAEDRAALLVAQDGRCPVCGNALGVDDRALDLPSSKAIVHARCRDLVQAVQGLGPEGLERLRRLLRPGTRPRRPRT